MPGSLEPFSGEETFAAPPARAHAVLTDLDALASAMPGLVSSQRVDDRTLKAVVRPGFSFLGGQIKLTLTLAESTPPTGALIRVHAQSIGVQMHVESRLALAPLDGGARTRLSWTARAYDFAGLIVAVPAGLVRAAAEQTIADGWRALRPRVELPA